MPMTRKVFISYRSSERATIEKMVAAIEQAGDYHVWYDQKIVGGQSWWEEILDALEDADIVVLALSPAYMASEACRLEMDYALRLGKAILPVRIDPALDVGQLGAQLQSRQILNFPADDADKLAMALNAFRPGTPAANAKRPAAPISPLAEIRDLITAPGDLLPATQQGIVDALRWHLRRQPGDVAQVSASLNQLNSKPNISRQVSDEITSILSSLPESRGFASRRALIGGVLAVILFIAALVIVPMLSRQSAVDDPTFTPSGDTQQTVSTPLPAQPGAFDLTLIYGTRDSFTVLLNGESHLAELTLETPTLTEPISQGFESLAATGYVGNSGVCLRYIREGTQPVLPRGCNAGQTFEVALPDADVFWFDDASNQYVNIAFRQSGELIGLCPHAGGSGRCNFEKDN